MRRGEIAEQVGVNRSTVLFYEQRGLIPAPRRGRGGYRFYTEEHIAEIRFIKRAQNLGFTLQEIKDLMAVRLDADSDCVEMRAHIRTKTEKIEEKIRDLERIRGALIELEGVCNGQGSTRKCTITKALESDGDENRSHGQEGRCGCH